MGHASLLIIIAKKMQSVYSKTESDKIVDGLNDLNQ